MSKSKFLEKKIKKNEIYSGKSVNFRVDEVSLPDGKKAGREFLDHPGAVAVLPLDEKGKIVFVKQYRYPVGRETLEIPAGKLHFGKDNPLFRAKAELREETGYTAGKFIHIADFWPTPAFSNELLKIYLAKNLKPGKISPDEDEFVETEKLGFKKALQLVKRGEIKDSKTIIALLYYKLFLAKKG